MILDKHEWMSAVYWMIQGDGNLSKPAQGKNYYFQAVHKVDNADYVAWKGEILSQRVGISLKNYYHSKAGKYFVKLYGATHPVFTQLREAIYLDGQKRLCEHGLKLLDARALAILFQDDGRMSTDGFIEIHKPLLSVIEQEALAKRIVDNWGIIFRVRKSCQLSDGSQGHSLGLRKKDVGNFIAIVYPYIANSMLYKVTTGGSANADMT